MQNTRIATIGLAVGGGSSSLMGAYHFFLPFMFGWGPYVEKLPPAVHWGVYSINFFFSLLLLAGGLLTVVALRTLRRGAAPDRGILIAMAGFWILNLLYQLFIPMPLPPHLWAVRLGTVGYAVVPIVAYIVALRAIR